MKNSRHDFQGYYINMLTCSLFVHPVTGGSDFMSPYRRSRSMHAQDVTPCHVISRPHLWPIETLHMGINAWYVISRHLKRYQNSLACRWSGDIEVVSQLQLIHLDISRLYSKPCLPHMLLVAKLAKLAKLAKYKVMQKN